MIEDLLKSDGMGDILADGEFTSVDNFTESTFFRCAQKIWEPKTKSKSKDHAEFYYDPKEIKEICHKEIHGVGHYHGPYPCELSETDELTYAHLMKQGAQDGIVVGINGICVETFTGHRFKIDWSPEFFKKLRKRGHQVIDNVQSVTCTRQEKPFFVECSIKQDNAQSTPFITAQAVIYDPRLKGFLYPYQWIDEKHESDKIMHFPFEENGYCVISRDKKKQISVLTCMANED